jgi:hypothetical protein
MFGPPLFIEGVEKCTIDTSHVSLCPDRGPNPGFHYFSQDPALGGIIVVCRTIHTHIGNLRNSMPGLPSACYCVCHLSLAPYENVSPANIVSCRFNSFLLLNFTIRLIRRTTLITYIVGWPRAVTFVLYPPASFFGICYS